jgi:oxygen-independent coproporphyrinogen-3 oxidase
MGFNRLSIGLQSAHDHELARLGRVHSYGQFLQTYGEARLAGFQNINVDVMSAIPSQTTESYRATLRTLLSLEPQPEHISAYGLILEEGTLFWEMEQSGHLDDLPDEETACQMLEETRVLLSEAGYHQYEISNFAKEGYECIHNTGYWIRREYAGFGLGAASLHKNVRYSNTRDLEHYLRYTKSDVAKRYGLQELSRDVSPNEKIYDLHNETIVDVHELSVQEQMEEFLFLGLRLMRGVSAKDFEKTFHRSLFDCYAKPIIQNIMNGLLDVSFGEDQMSSKSQTSISIKMGSVKKLPTKEVTDVNDLKKQLSAQSDFRIFLTPRGILLSNIVFSSF